jgi:hypothetical protein
MLTATGLNCRPALHMSHVLSPLLEPQPLGPVELEGAVPSPGEGLMSLVRERSGLLIQPRGPGRLKSLGFVIARKRRVARDRPAYYDGEAAMVIAARCRVPLRCRTLASVLP